MNEKIDLVKSDFSKDFASVSDLETLESLRVKYFSRNGIFAKLFDEFKVACVRHKLSFQKLAERTIHLYLTDDEFRKEIHNHNNLELNLNQHRNKRKKEIKESHYHCL